MNFFRHESAVVDAGAAIGDDSKIWHFSHIAAGARIGRRCVIGQNVYVAPMVVVGDDVHIQNNVSLYDGVFVEDFAFLGPSAVFTNVLTPRSEFPRRTEFRETRVCRGATVGANSTILCGHKIGAYAMIGAGAVVTANVPAYALIIGVPARQIGWICRCGERLDIARGAGYCATCGRGYRSDGEVLCEA